MSLLTDIIFVKALRADSALMQQLPAGDVYNTTIGLPDTELDNAEVPYIIVRFDGLTNETETKDDPFEGSTDNVEISIEIAARNRLELGSIATRVRKAVHDYCLNADPVDGDYSFVQIPTDYSFSAQAVNYDPDKPCHWQILNYQCDCPNDVIVNPDETE